ncbi:Indoleamine 2,3-dioxygenase [Guyanagaster necrorhizus]|uniref:Indoleamine 2,3-dioxygenase n=1 Tax=Guyanagaster necrorhizus TaxID=856835 RepID=A0A9P7W2L1_9AGAR|nr:Indoleamine 2,3-dioxygenase [Guyanagaster necrorhizus MCA 3950]KAG7451434.1 Indoleamine 2,3-dioxygenase [Guyanagaster necrorhizus MCA 3950]
MIRLEDFDISPDTGFLGSQPHLHLSGEWTMWEDLLEHAMERKLVLGESAAYSEATLTESARWRMRVCEAPLLSATVLDGSLPALRRAHHVLSFILHFYVHTLPPDRAICIPPPLSVPLSHISNVLDLPPVITYSDLVLYNWTTDPSTGEIYFPSVFSGQGDEQAFYRASAVIELRGVEALDLIRQISDNILVGAVAQITKALVRMSVLIDDFKKVLLGLRKDCNSEVYYQQVRPWLRGEDSPPRKWMFQGLPGDSSEMFKELSGPSAGQSTLIHALDIFFGINNHLANGTRSLFGRMQRYMPREHRRFLTRLSSSPRSLRGFIKDSSDRELLDAYNNAVLALKAFRDVHMVIATLYIVVPANRVGRSVSTDIEYIGTGGTGFVPFLKGIRDRTEESVLHSESVSW